MDDLFPRGGDDVGRPSLLGMSRTPSYARKPSIQKVHAFLFDDDPDDVQCGKDESGDNSPLHD